MLESAEDVHRGVEHDVFGLYISENGLRNMVEHHRAERRDLLE